MFQDFGQYWVRVLSRVSSAISTHAKLIFHPVSDLFKKDWGQLRFLSLPYPSIPVFLPSLPFPPAFYCSLPFPLAYNGDPVYYRTGKKFEITDARYLVSFIEFLRQKIQFDKRSFSE
jgi:hypothetical protein